jgi:prepilin-type N-terminal cleavage/methylation domain-containing protein
MRLAKSRPEHGTRRPAFTLIELLVVIAIIAILMALTTGGVFAIINTQRQNNTETSLQTIMQVFEQQWAKVIIDAKKESPLPPVVMALADNDPNRARVIWIKIRLMEAFPMSYAEIQNPVVYDPNAVPNGPLIPASFQRKYIKTYQKILGSRQGANPPAPTEAGACLLMALSINRGGVALSPDKVRTADTDLDGIPELIDGWGAALGFYRFPTGNADLQSSNPSPGQFNDPLDPTGLLVSSTWTKQNQNTFQQLIHPVSANGLAPSYYIIPVIVSAGTNMNLGLAPGTMAVTDQNASNDNVYSYVLKQGGRS